MHGVQLSVSRQPAFRRCGRIHRNTLVPGVALGSAESGPPLSRRGGSGGAEFFISYFFSRLARIRLKAAGIRYRWEHRYRMRVQPSPLGKVSTAVPLTDEVDNVSF